MKDGTMPVISAFGMWKQENQEFKVILGYVRPYLKLIKVKLVRKL